MGESNPVSFSFVGKSADLDDDPRNAMITSAEPRMAETKSGSNAPNPPQTTKTDTVAVTTGEDSSSCRYPRKTTGIQNGATLPDVDAKNPTPAAASPFTGAFSQGGKEPSSICIRIVAPEQ